MSDDLTPTSRVPGLSEIVGLVAGMLPFVVSSSTSSSTTVNGEVTDFVYRDHVAIAGGVVALACGVISLLLLRRTSNKLARIALVVGLLALGGLQLARGFGVLASGAATSSTSSTFTTVTTVTKPPEPRPREVDVTEPTRRFAELWSAGKLDEIYRQVHPRLREAAKFEMIQRIHRLFELGFGKLTKLGVIRQTTKEGVYAVTAPAIFEQGELGLRLEFALDEATPKLISFNFDIPAALQRQANPEDADRIAAKFLDELLAGTLDRSVLDPRVISNLTPKLDELLAAARAELGPLKGKAKLIGTPCGVEKRCLQAELRGRKKQKTFTIELEYAVHSWLVVAFNLAAK